MLKSTYTPLPPLPAGWTEHKAPSGHLYYYNSETKQSTYKRPTAPPPEPQPAPSALPQHPSFPPNFNAAQPSSAPFYTGPDFGRSQRRGGGRRHDRRQPEDRPKTKHEIPGCPTWFLVKTRLGRRFVHNIETNESFWKFPEDVLKGVIEYDRLEREKRERAERGEQSEPEAGCSKEGSRDREATVQDQQPHGQAEGVGAVGIGIEDGEDSDEYEEVEVTDEEEEELPSKKLRSEEGNDQPLEFNEDDIAYQLAAMGEEYGLDPGEYGEPGDEDWEEGDEGLPLTWEDAKGLFRDLLDDFRINPYTPWERIVEEGRIIDDSRYTLLPNMKARREVWSEWSKDRIQERKEQKEKDEKKDPRIRYLALLQESATPKLYWPEFKRKYRKEPEMKDSRMVDKDRERLYRDLVARLKLPESTRKSDLSALLKSIPGHQLNRSSTTETLPPNILVDLRYVSLPSKVREPLIDTYISTLPEAPEPLEITAAEKEEREKREEDRKRRENALVERQKKVQEHKRNQRRALLKGKELLRQEDEEIQRAMNVGNEGLRRYVEEDEHLDKETEDPSRT